DLVLLGPCLLGGSVFLGPQSGGGGSRGHSLGGLCIFDFAGCPFLKQEEEEQEEGGDGAAGDPKKEKKSLDSDESEDEEDDYQQKRKGVEGLIDIENPNRVAQTTKKVTQLDLDGPKELSRREREEIEKQKAKERYMKMHLAGKTEQAKADLARLAIIRKQREEAARKKEEERKGKSGARVAACPVPGQPPNPALHCPRCVTGWGCVVE
uniref:PDGFA associated protein 1 n=1 Tax=Neovison vison TaxID=452646 RepID=A0A8C7AR06_NEOVI